MYLIPWFMLAFAVFGNPFVFLVANSSTLITLGILPALGGLLVRPRLLGAFLGGGVSFSLSALYLMEKQPENWSEWSVFTVFVVFVVVGGYFGIGTGALTLVSLRR